MNRGLQLASCSADGLLRLWTIRSGECENTFDRHRDKIWALAAPPEAYYHISADGVDDKDTETEKEEDDPSNDDAMAAQEAGETRRLLFTGGSDSRLLLWQDATREQESNRLHEAEQEILLEQQMQNDLRHKRFGKVSESCCVILHRICYRILCCILLVCYTWRIIYIPTSCVSRLTHTHSFPSLTRVVGGFELCHTRGD